jgi:hypothetical protein
VGLTLVVGKGRIRVERDPAPCGRLNEEVGCNTPGVYILLDNEYGFKHVISVNKTDTKV